LNEKKYRDQGATVKRDIQNFPNTVTFSRMLLFWFFPTLCYQLEYPRTDKISFYRLFGKLATFFVLSSIIYVIAFQYIYPAIVNSMPYLDDPLVNTPKIIERILKAAVPNLYLWLISFYALFDCFLGALAELTYFGDTKFYGDWWNARTLGYYWSNWNLPVHAWMKRHIMIPLLNLGFSKNFGVFICFFISALGHEFILAVPFGLKGIAFFGILAQIALIFITEKLKNYHYAGNIIFWLSISLGQPFLTVLYYRDYLASTRA